MEWARPAPAKHNRLPTSFIHLAIALQTTRYADRFAFGWIGRDQSWIGPGTESLGAGHGVWRNQLHNSQSILSVCDQRKLRGAHTADLHSARIVQHTTGVKHLVKTGGLRIFNINNRKPLRTIRDICVSARDV